MELAAELLRVGDMSFGVCSLLFLSSVTEEFTGLFAPSLLFSLVSRRSIMRDTVAIPAFTSLLTSEPISEMEELRENSFSFHSFVLFEIDSLYLQMFT